MGACPTPNLATSRTPPACPPQIGQTALHVAALHGNLEAMAACLALGLGVDVPNNRGQTPLHFAAAAHSNAHAACELLLRHGASKHASDSVGRLAFENTQDDEIR